MKSKHLKAINAILEDFNFDRVHTMMKSVGWAWHDSKGVPSQSELFEAARKLLIMAVEEKSIIATGGFRASYKKYPDGDRMLTLDFIADESEEIYK